MLSARGAGEVPISISGDPTTAGTLVHTVRAVGLATEAICASEPGDVLGVRGPFGVPWPVGDLAGADVAVVAGGIGLAPLRPAILALLAERERYGRLLLLYGGRGPDQLLYADELGAWAARGLEVTTTVDSAGPEWLGHVGVVTRLVNRASIDPAATVALLCGPEVMMRFTVAALQARGVPGERIHASMERNMQCGIGHCGHCQLGPCDPVPRRAGPALERARAVAGDQGAVMDRQTIAVWKFSSCDGCQLSLLDCEDELLTLADRVEIAYFLEATSATAEGPYDVSIVEGSITTPHDAERIREVRRASRTLITIGACATAGGIQALRNFGDVDEFAGAVYASPDFITTLRASTPISDHVPVDFELNGCPINKAQLLEVLAAHLGRRRPRVRRAQRVRRVQAPRHGMRDRRARHTVPGARDARGLRRAVPLLPARLLRLLRPDGEPEHGRLERPDGGPRRRGRRSRARLPHLQRREPRVPRRERAP